MKLYNTSWGCYVEEGARYYPIAGERWDAVVNRQDLKGFLASVIGSAQSVEEIKDILAPSGRSCSSSRLRHMWPGLAQRCASAETRAGLFPSRS